jgi:hypothetical protein
MFDQRIGIRSKFRVVDWCVSDGGFRQSKSVAVGAVGIGVEVGIDVLIALTELQSQGVARDFVE